MDGSNLIQKVQTESRKILLKMAQIIKKERWIEMNKFWQKTTNAWINDLPVKLFQAKCPHRMIQKKVNKWLKISCITQSLPIHKKIELFEVENLRLFHFALRNKTISLGEHVLSIIE